MNPFDKIKLDINENCVLISGSVLSGNYVEVDQSLDYYHECLTILKNNNDNRI